MKIIYKVGGVKGLWFFCDKVILYISVFIFWFCMGEGVKKVVFRVVVGFFFELIMLYFFFVFFVMFFFRKFSKSGIRLKFVCVF